MTLNAPSTLDAGGVTLREDEGASSEEFGASQEAGGSSAAVACSSDVVDCCSNHLRNVTPRIPRACLIVIHITCALGLSSKDRLFARCVTCMWTQSIGVCI